MSREISKNEEAFSELRMKIKMARLAMGLTQAEFAERAGVASGAKLSKIETGLQKPDLKDLKKISNFANISLKELLEDPVDLLMSALRESSAAQAGFNRVDTSTKPSDLDSYNRLLLAKMTEVLKYDGSDKDFLLKRYQTIESLERLHHSLRETKSDSSKKNK